MTDARTNTDQNAGAKSTEGSEVSRIMTRLDQIDANVIAAKAVLNRGAFSVESFAQANDLSVRTVFEEIKAGRLKKMKVGRRTLISVEAAVDWRRRIEEETAAAEEAAA